MRWILVTIAMTSPAAAADWAAMPLVNYSSDLGLGLGARARLLEDALTVEAQAFASTGGSQFHFASVDWSRPGGWRIDALAGYTRNTAAPYYGIGAHAPAEPDSFHAYDGQAPLVRVRARRGVRGPLSLTFGARGLWTWIQAGPASQLAIDAPRGSMGGPYGELSLGLAWDTRDHELRPTRGMLAEVTARASAPGWGYGAFASLSVWQQAGARLVLAARAAADVTGGDVPFDRLQDFGSLVSPFYAVSGLGGGLTVRGLPQSEYIGFGKAILNLEARLHLFSLEVRGHQLGLGAVAFTDAGRVWPGELHAGAGGGLRIFWGEHFVLRADAGYAEGSVRVYADFGHIF